MAKDWHLLMTPCRLSCPPLPRRPSDVEMSKLAPLQRGQRSGRPRSLSTLQRVPRGHKLMAEPIGVTDRGG